MPSQVSREELADIIRDLVTRHPGTVLIAIDGLGGSGKTYLTQWLVSGIDVQTNGSRARSETLDVLGPRAY